MTKYIKFSLFILTCLSSGCLGNTFSESPVIPTLASTAELPQSAPTLTSPLNPSEQATHSSNPNVTNDSNSSLALQLGFSDEHVQEAAAEGARLEMILSSNIGEQSYVVFYLEKDFEPRIINDFQTIILIYEGTPDSVSNFVHRIEVNSDNLDGIQNVNSSQFLPLKIEHDVITSYMATGFTPIAERMSIDKRDREYYAVVMQYNDLFYMVTFTKEPSSEIYHYLSDFQVFNSMCEDTDSEFFDDYPSYAICAIEPEDVLFFQKEWQNLKPISMDIPPKSISEKALYAIGCDFSDRVLKHTYEDSQFIVYACDWIKSANQMDYLEPSKLVSIFQENAQSSRFLWNLYVPQYRDIQVEWDDANIDSIPDITLTLIKDMGGSGGGELLGSQVYQPLSNGNLVDIMYGVSLDTSMREDITFEDLDNDGTAELVDYAAIIGISEGTIGWGRSQAASRIYRLDGDYYYTIANQDFDFLCLEEIAELSIEIKNTPLNELLSNINVWPPSTKASYINIDNYHAFMESLITCDIMGIKEQNREAFISALKQHFPEGCNGFIYSLNYEDYITYINESFQFTDDFISYSQPDYWSDLFDDYAQECSES